MEEAVARSAQILEEFLETHDENTPLEQKNAAICAAAFLCIRKALKYHDILPERASELIQTLKSAGFPGTEDLDLSLQDLDLSLFREAGGQS